MFFETKYRYVKTSYRIEFSNKGSFLPSFDQIQLQISADKDHRVGGGEEVKFPIDQKMFIRLITANKVETKKLL